jgi:hypothetical protein
MAIWRKLRVGLAVISISVPQVLRIEEEGERRDRKRVRNVWAGRMLGGVCARYLDISRRFARVRMERTAVHL